MLATETQVDQLLQFLTLPKKKLPNKIGGKKMSQNDLKESINLKDQIAIVTGGGTGTGQAIAIALATAGATVAVISRSPEHLNKTVELIKEKGGRGYAFPADVTDRPTVERTIKQIENQFGRVDLLVNSAATNSPLGPIWEVDPEQWWRCESINLQGPFLCIHAVMPGMIKHGRGRIINISSGSYDISLPYLSAYFVSKCGLTKLTEILAIEAQEYGISVFAIEPGIVKNTTLNDNCLTEEAQKYMPWFKDRYDADAQNPDEVIKRILYLAAGKADQLTGQYIGHLDNIFG